MGKGEKGKTHAKFWVSIDKHLLAPLAAHIRRHLCKLARLALLLNLEGIQRHLVLEQPRRVGPPPQQQRRVRLLRLDNRLLDVLVNGRLDGAHEARAHVDAACAEHQRRRQALTVCEAARRDKGRIERLPRAAQQDEVCNVALADVARTLEAVDAEEINTQFDGALGVADGGALVQDDDAGGLELADDGAGRVTGGLDDLDALVDDGLRVGRVVGRQHGGQQRQVDGEGVLGQGAAALDLGAEGLGGGEDEGRDDAQTAGVGDGRGEVCGADVHHAALNDGDCGWTVS